MAKDQSLARKFGMAAVGMGLATKKQITRALSEQKRLLDEDQTVLISEILIKAEVITEEQRDEIIQKQKELKAKDPDEDTEGPDIKGGKKVQDDSGFELAISQDKIEAYICPIKEDLPDVNIETIKRLLETEGIKYGIVDDTEINEYLGSQPVQDKLWKIAQGKAPDPGKPPEIKYHFDTEPLKVATFDEKGNIDYKNRGKIPQVEEGDLLAEIIPGQEGKSGKDIYDEEAFPEEYPPAEILFGISVKKAEEGTQAVSEMKGMAELGNDGSINVTDTLTIASDVGIETGHIEFDGHIQIKGGIQEGYKVKGKSIVTINTLHSNP